MRTLKVLSALLTYPTQELQAAAPELKAALDAEAVLPRAHRDAVVRLVDDLAGRDLYDAQERYILLFDRTRSLSLHLFEHVHGESRDRGQAMVDLIGLYRAGGFEPVGGELPDFLPLFLEYAATQPPEEAIALIGQPATVLEALRERLVKRGSPYEAVPAALVALARVRLDESALAALRAEPDPEPDDLDALDAAWESEPVTFGPDAFGSSSGGGCPTARMTARLEAAAADPRPLRSRTPSRPGA
jgi:nitrate reductase delta subunit